jgi:mRNA interferase MazF
VIVSHDAFNQTPAWRSVIVVPLATSEAQRRRGPTAVPVRRGAAGLARDGVALCHQVTTLDRTKLTRRIGALTAALLHDLDEGLRVALALR